MSNGIVDQVKNIMDIFCRLSTELRNPITEKDYIIEDRGCPHLTHCTYCDSVI